MSAANLRMVNEAPASRPRGFPGLPCPRCGDVDCVDVRLNDCSFRCGACEAEFDSAEVRALINAWLPVLCWIERAPVIE